MTALLVRRSVAGMARQPGAWLPGLLFPLLIAAVFTANYGRAGVLLGLPEGASYLSFILPAAVIVGGLYAGVAAGTAVTSDLTGGFLSRMALTPMPRAMILVGPLAAAALQGLLQGSLFVLVFGALGAETNGAEAVVCTAPLLAVAMAGLTIALGLKAGTGEIMISLFGLLFLCLFVSSAFFPAGYMQGWFGAVAQYSPFTWLADGLRAGDLAKAAGTALGLGVLTVAWALSALYRTTGGEP
ncbi:ABC transporter permease [Actinocorallia sp. B10E7]|uniref:ABC transporter permease n=1 Tax=Actinocorallia sp. B10E7 TaxID=3153558 RepID=UPI00325D2701